MQELEQLKGEYRDVPGQLYLDRVEAAGMGVLTKALNDGDVKKAWSVAKLLRYLNIV